MPGSRLLAPSSAADDMEENRVHRRVSLHTEVWRGGLGVEFLGLSPDNRERLAAYVDANS
tara:strand:+ start:320 stop:499 length:180 start_codon:yes stop_codon:yes gene_type:complete